MSLFAAYRLFVNSMVGVLSVQTIAWYQSKLKLLLEMFGNRPVANIAVDDLRAWRARLARKVQRWENHPTRLPIPGSLSPYTLHCHVRACRRLFNWLVQDGKLEINPAARLEKPKLPEELRRGISEIDALKILEIARANPRDYAIVLIFADTGCRLAGIAGLQLADLDLDRCRAWVREKGLGGNRKGRFIYFSDWTMTAIGSWLAARPAINNGSLFVGLKRGGPRAGWHELSGGGIYKLLKRLAARAGVRWGWNPHNWRHAVIRQWLEHNMPLSVASQLAGHSSEQITADIYGVFAERQLQEAHDRFSWVNQLENIQRNG